MDEKSNVRRQKNKKTNDKGLSPMALFTNFGADNSVRYHTSVKATGVSDNNGLSGTSKNALRR